MPESGEDPAFREQDARFGGRLIFGRADAGRDDGDANMLAEGLVGAVERDVDAFRFGDQRFGIVGHADARHPAKIGKGVDLPPDPPRGGLLGMDGHIRVATIPQHRHEDLTRRDLPGAGVHDG